MKRHLQTLEEIRESLSAIDSNWRDDFADEVIMQFSWLSQYSKIDTHVLRNLLDQNFEIGITIIRLFLELSKDEFNTLLRGKLFPNEPKFGKSFYANNPEVFLKGLNSIGLFELMNNAIQKSYTWSDILTERLKAGRGSAIKGQLRGRMLEDFVEEIIKSSFKSYDSRCNFIGKNNDFVAKADFAIPGKGNPNIVIEVKAYGATGSKQTDSLGDVEKIISNKRHDTYFFFFLDGITWLDRLSDLKKIVKYQNEGFIYRVYTMNMKDELISDLIKIKQEGNL